MRNLLNCICLPQIFASSVLGFQILRLLLIYLQNKEIVSRTDKELPNRATLIINTVVCMTKVEKEHKDSKVQARECAQMPYH